MRSNSLFRFMLNTVLLSLIPLSILNKITGNVLHEIIGVVIVFFIATHTFFNVHWFTLFWKQKMSFHRLFNTTILLLMVLAFLVLMASSLMISKSLFIFLGFKSTLLLRQLHTTSAYWFFIFGFIHLGIHWHRFSALLQKKFRIQALLSHPLFVFMGWLMVLYAVIVFIHRDIVSKLFMTFAFEFWNSEQSIWSIAFDYISMILALIILTRSFVKLQKRLN